MSIIVLLLFFLGAVVGSFLNVMVSRTVEGRDFVRGRSSCDFCHKQLVWYDMIPLFSYFFYGRKSRCCKKTLSWQHPIVEALTGVLFVWWYAVGSVFFQLVTEPLRTTQAVFWLMIGIVLLVICVSDLLYGVVPTIPVYAAIFMALLYRLLLYFIGPLTLFDLILYLLSAFFVGGFFYLLFVITKGHGMGMGDVIVAPLLGLILGYPKTIVAVLVAFWVGALVGLILLLLRKKKFGQTLPFVPFMVIGTVFALIFGNWSISLMF